VNMRSVDEVLSGSSPAFAPSVATEAALDALVLEARSAGGGKRGTRRRRALWLVPGAVFAVGALTAGALVIDQVTRVEEPIAVEYTTDTGVTVSCTAYVESSVFAPQLAAVTEFYKTHDFTDTGIGQRIYEYALVLTGDKQGTPDVLPASVTWLPDGSYEFDDDRGALRHSMLSFLVHDVILELGLYQGNVQSGFSSDCTGQLH
jgi:hypothetical protein